MVWRSASNLSSLTAMANSVLKVLDKDASDFDDLEGCGCFLLN